jgi:hypothetical protein
LVLAKRDARAPSLGLHGFAQKRHLRLEFADGSHDAIHGRPLRRAVRVPVAEAFVPAVAELLAEFTPNPLDLAEVGQRDAIDAECIACFSFLIALRAERRAIQEATMVMTPGPIETAASTA